MSKVINSTDSNFQSTVRTLLESGKAKVTFTKADGSTRTMTCTAQTGVVPATASTRNVAGVQTVYDLDINEWRSFRWDSVKTVEPIEG
jgi:hypothetical protein